MEQHTQVEDHDVILAALHGLKRCTQVPVLMYAECTEEGRLRISQWLGLKTHALQGLEICPGVGIGGRVLLSRRPVGVSDYTRAKTITHDFDQFINEENLHSLVAVPVIVQRDIRGVLYAGVHSRSRMGDKVLEEVMMSARCLEQDLAVNEALRLHEDPASYGTGLAAKIMSGAEWEQVRATHSRLRILANRVGDDDLRRDLEMLCEQMVAPVKMKNQTKLSGRELDVLSCVALGHTNVEAAEEMGIGPETVKSYLRSSMRKLGAHTRYEAVNAARRIGALP